MYSKIIVIGDIHGDFKSFKYILKMADIINSKQEWIGENTLVIQVGDTIDGKRPGLKLSKHFKKTAEEIKLLDFIDAISKKAEEKGGRLVCLLGNHELFPYYLHDDVEHMHEYVKKSDIEEYKIKKKCSKKGLFLSW